MNSINKNLNEIIDNKIEGISISDEMISDKVTKVKNKKKKERKIDEKLKEVVKYVFDEFMNKQKIIDYNLIDERMNEIDTVYDKRLYDIEKIIMLNDNNMSNNNNDNNNVSNNNNGNNMSNDNNV